MEQQRTLILFNHPVLAEKDITFTSCAVLCIMMPSVPTSTSLQPINENYCCHTGVWEEIAEVRRAGHQPSRRGYEAIEQTLWLLRRKPHLTHWISIVAHGQHKEFKHSEMLRISWLSWSEHGFFTHAFGTNCTQQLRNSEYWTIEYDVIPGNDDSSNTRSPQASIAT